MAISVGQYDKLLKDFQQKGVKALEGYLDGTGESNRKLLEILKEAYRRAATALIRPNQEGQKDTEDNRDLFNALCDEAGKKHLYKKIDKQERKEALDSFKTQLSIYHKSYRVATILGERHPLLDMGFHFGDFKDDKKPGTSRTEREADLQAGGDLTGRILSTTEGEKIIKNLSNTLNQQKEPSNSLNNRQEKIRRIPKTTYDKRGAPETHF